MMPHRYFSFLLHAHLPWVLGHGRWPHGVEWVCEATLGSYLPLIRVLAKETAPFSIRVNAIVPGATSNAFAKTPWFNDLVRETGGAREAFEKIGKMSTPMARYANSDDIGRLIVMLLSDESPLTGATLVVDGGYTL